jgi:hypothetical protein
MIPAMTSESQAMLKREQTPALLMDPGLCTAWYIKEKGHFKKINKSNC